MSLGRVLDEVIRLLEPRRHYTGDEIVEKDVVYVNTC